MILSTSKKKQTLQEIVIDTYTTTQPKDNITIELSNLQCKINKNKYEYKEIYRTNIINDQPYGEDFLGYDKYARALSYILLSEQIELPISAGIFSSWGTGKTFLLKRIEHHIKELVQRDSSKKIVIVNFNAWEYSGADVLWAGLVKNIYESTERKFTQCQTRFFRHFIYPFRERTNKQIGLLIFSWIFRILLIIITTIILATMDKWVDELTKLITCFSIFGVALLSMLPNIIISIIGLLKNKGKETMKSAKNIDEKVGFMADVKRELEILCDFMKYKQNHKFVVFIDDLDRCPPNQIIKILDAVMLLLSNKNFPFLTFIAIDPRIIISSIESSFKKRILNSGINGFEYIDKLIQIPFCIPISSPSIKKDIIEILTRDKVELLNQILNKIVIFIDKYNLYDIINIRQEDTKSNNVYQSKVKIIHSMFLYFDKKFSNLHINKNKKKKYKNQIYTLQEKCQFINKVLLFIDYKLKDNTNITQKCSDCCKKKRNFDELEKELFDLDKFKNTTTSINSINSINLQNIPNNILNEVDNNIQQLQLKMKQQTLTDEEILIYGEHLLENKETIMLQTMVDLNIYLKKIIDVYSRFSPYKTELNNLLYNIEEFLEQTHKQNSVVSLQDKFIKSFSQPEINYLNKIHMYLDGNCRRNKRIINIFSISRYIMGNRIKGWYSNKVVNMNIKKKLIKLIILAEQWGYRLSWIFQKIEDYRQCKENIIKCNSLQKTTKSSEWIKINGNITINYIYELINSKLLFHQNLKIFLSLDYDPDIFVQFINTKPDVTIDDFYLLIPYLFNINLYIKNKIAEVSDKIRFLKKNI